MRALKHHFHIGRKQRLEESNEEPEPIVATKTAVVESELNTHSVTSLFTKETSSSPPLKCAPAQQPAANATIERLPSSAKSLQTSLERRPSSASQTSTAMNSVYRATSHRSRALANRYEEFPNGTHVHHLRNARRQEKLGRMLREIMGGGAKIAHDAVSAVPALHNANVDTLSLMSGLLHQVKAGEVELGRISGASPRDTKRRSGYVSPSPAKQKKLTQQSLLDKYGKTQEVVGKGSYGIVRITQKMDPKTGKSVCFAVKEFKKRPGEAAPDLQDRLMSEFCIANSLHHHNIITTLDLMRDTQGECCQIMEYCPGGDLYSLILCSGGIQINEANCFFKQIVRGVVYMHSMGVSHCDIKPENILLTSEGVCKISDFGSAECFRLAWEKDVHLSSAVFGSGPYIAPEEFKTKPFDSRLVDVWALGVLYVVMRTGSYLWQEANLECDEHYAKYVHDRKLSRGYAPIEKLEPSICVYVIYSILDPVASRRLTAKQILNSEWGRSIRLCAAADPPELHSSCSSYMRESLAGSPGTVSSETFEPYAVKEPEKNQDGQQQV